MYKKENLQKKRQNMIFLCQMLACIFVAFHLLCPSYLSLLHILCLAFFFVLRLLCIESFSLHLLCWRCLLITQLQCITTQLRMLPISAQVEWVIFRQNFDVDLFSLIATQFLLNLICGPGRVHQFLGVITYLPLSPTQT